MALRGESILPDPTLDASVLSPIMKLTERRSADGNGDFSSALFKKKNKNKFKKKKKQIQSTRSTEFFKKIYWRFITEMGSLSKS